jgi:hypothetical protein
MKKAPGHQMRTYCEQFAMLRFSIRDLLWVTVIAALACAWWVHAVRTENQRLRGNVAYEVLEARLRSVEAKRDLFNQLNAQFIKEVEDENNELKKELEFSRTKPAPESSALNDVQTPAVRGAVTMENQTMAEPRIIRKARIRVHEFVVRPGNKEFHYDSQRDELQSLLSKRALTEKDLIHIGSNLGQIGTWRIRTGGLAVLEGKNDAWAEFHFGMTVAALEFRQLFFATTQRPAGDRASTTTYIPALVLAHAMAIGDDLLANEMGDVITKGVANGVFNGYNEHGYELFIINLFQTSRGEPRRNIGLDPPNTRDRFQEVWQTWDSVDELSKECANLCDTHLDIAEDKTGDSYGQFEIDPCEIYPVEILALQRIRKKLGLPVPSCDHQLMKSRLADAPTEPPKIDDDLAERIRAKLRTVYDEF